MTKVLFGALVGMLVGGHAVAQTCATQGISDTSYRGDNLPPGFLVFTYDDGPDTYSLSLAQYLRGQGIRTTFFIRGCHVPDYPNNPAQYVSLGHRVAVHTETHTPLPILLGTNYTCLAYQPKYPAPAWDPEIVNVDNFLSPFVTDGVYLLRGPGGAWNDNGSTDCDGIIRDAAAGVRGVVSRNCANHPKLAKLTGPILWNVPLNNKPDWDCFGYNGIVDSAAQCAAGYVNDINTVGSGIILFHDWLEFSGNSSAVETAATDCVVGNERQINNTGPRGRYKGDDKPLQLAQALIPNLKSQGYQIVSTDAVPGLPGGQDFAAFTSLWQSDFSDAGGWANPGFYSSIRYVDVNADGYTDVCARTAAGIGCALNNKAGKFGALTTWLASTQLQGLPLDDLHSRTIQFADINGDSKLDVCWLTNSTIYCALHNSFAGAFNNSSAWSSVGMFSGWEVPQYASSLYIGLLGTNPSTGHKDVGVCGRGIGGIYCAVSNGTSFGSFGPPWQTGFSDAAGWNGNGFYSTIRFADVTGDGIVDVCGQGFQSVFCATGDLTNRQFVGFSQWTSWGRYLSDYTDDMHNASIRLAKTGLSSRADLCIRVGVGELCAPNVSGSFDPFKTVYKPVNDPNGWGSTAYATTVEFVPNLTPNVAGNPMSICGRAIDGIHCAQRL